jgi:hypothetical protein
MTTACSLELTRARVLWEDDRANERGGVFLPDAGAEQTSNDPLYRHGQAEVRLSDYSQTTLPKKIRAMSAGPQSPVLTFTKVPATSAQPAI